MGEGGAYFAPETSFQDVCFRAGVKDALQELGYTQPGKVSQEQIVHLDPDILIVANWYLSVPQEPEKAVESILLNPAYRTTKAVQNKQVVLIQGAHILAVSQYITDAVENVAKLAYPECFE